MHTTHTQISQAQRSIVCYTCGAHPCQADPPVPAQAGTAHSSRSISRVQPQIRCARADKLRRWGEKREGYFPAVNSWFEDGASLLQIDLIFPCPKMALRSTSSSALQHWLCPAPVLNPGQLCKKRQTAVPYNLYLGESLITDFHSQMIFLYRNAI